MLKMGRSGNSDDEAGSHCTNDSDERPKSESSPPLAENSDGNNNKVQATPGEGEDKPSDAPLVNADDRADKDGTEGEKIYVPRKYDVLLGRGRPLQDHPGNLRFHKIINRARATYLNSRKEGKAGIAKEVMYEIKTSKKNAESKSNQPSEGDGDGGGDDVNSPSSGGEPGRFLKKVGDANASGEDVYWIEVSQEVAIEKISHALRGRPRSETSNRSDGPGGSKGGGSSGGDKSQSGVVSRRWRHSENKDSSPPSGGNPKRKGPPSPPTNETPSDIGTDISGGKAGGATSIQSGNNKALQRSNITDAIFTTNANTPNSIPTSSNTTDSTNTASGNASTLPAQPMYGTLDNQMQSVLASWQLQQFQAAMQLQQQNAQQVAQQQLLQQLVQQQQQQLAAAGVGSSGTANAFGQNQQPQLNTGVVGQLPAQQQQQQLQLLLQQQQALQLLQQQAQQLQPQQVQYVLPQNQLQPQQQQQQQMQSTSQQPQQAQAQQQIEQYLQQQQNLSTTTSSSAIGNPVAPNVASAGTAMDSNVLAAATAILSTLQQTTGNTIVNATTNTPNILSHTPAVLSAPQPPAAPNPISQNPMVPQPGTNQVVAGPGSQLQQQLQQLQQLQQQQVLQNILQQSQALLAAMNPQQPLQQNPSASSTSQTSQQHQPQPPGGNPPPPNNPS